MAKVFSIFNHRTKEFITINGRVAWTKRGNAQNVLDDAYRMYDSDYAEVYEIIELSKWFDLRKHLMRKTKELK